jgi:hypothetical protein
LLRMNACAKEHFRGLDIADAGDALLIHQE